MNISKNSQAYQIISAIALMGEYPYYSINIIPYRCKEWCQKEIRHLINEDYIGVSKGKKQKVLRLKKKGKDVLFDINVLLYDHYKNAINNNTLSGDTEHIWRNCRHAEVMQMMKQADVRVCLKEKPPLIKGEQYPLYSRPNMYYTSREIKQSPEVKKEVITENIAYARMCGAYITGNGIYGVYNTNKSIILCNMDTEEYMLSLLSACADDFEWKNGNQLKTRMILISDNPQIAQDLLDGKYDKMKKRESKIAINSSEYQKGSGNNLSERFHMTDFLYKLHYVPMNMDGIKQLKLYGIPDYLEKLREIGIPPEAKKERGKYFRLDADGYNADNKYYYYIFYDSDLVRLKRFKEGIDMEKLSTEHYAIECFPWQVEILKAYFPADVKLYTTNSIDKVLENLESMKTQSSDQDTDN